MTPEKRAASALGGEPLRAPKATTDRTSGTSAWVLSSAVTFSLTFGFAAFVPGLWHWMLMPTMACGVLIGVDAASWLLSRTDVLAPKSVVGLFGYHFLFLAPLLHVAWNHWPHYVAPASDWRNALGVLGLVNMLGLTIYRLVMSLPNSPRSSSIVQVNERRFMAWAGVAALLSASTFAYIVYSFGGLSGYLFVVTSGRDALEGNGWLLLIGEAWPLLLLSMILVRRRAWLRDHRAALLLLVATFVAAQFLTGGLRGSRSNTVWPTLIAIGIVHLMVTQVRKRALLVGALIIGAFMYVYGFYKSVGSEALNVMTGHVSTESLARETGRNLPLLVLEDFGRAGTQAIIIDRQETETAPLGWGAGYVGDVAKLIPSSIFPNPPADKVELGTDTLYGDGAFASGMRSSRIYGLAGEGMLNFGIIGGVLAFLPFAFVVRYVSGVYDAARLSGSIGAHLLAPALSVTTVMMLGSDFDNVVWFLLKQVIPLALVVWLARSKLG